MDKVKHSSPTVKAVKSAFDGNDQWKQLQIKAEELYQKIAADPNYTLAAVGAAILVLLITIVLIKKLFGSSRKGNGLLLVGLAEAGKTVIFTRLLTGKFVHTLTSMKHNETDLRTKKRTLRLIDLPGYDRLREKYWTDFNAQARGIVFVVDSMQFMSNFRDVADFLYTVLADPFVTKNRIPVLVACNKQDEARAKSSKVIQSHLEKEINNIRATRSAALDSIDDNAQAAVLLGSPNRDFSYSDLKTPITFVNCSSNDAGGEQGLDEVWNWINKL